MQSNIGCIKSVINKYYFRKFFSYKLIKCNNMTIIKEPIMHKFEKNIIDEKKPGGISGMAMLCESHVSIHTYPETNTIYADIFSCKTLNKEKYCIYERIWC